MTTVDMSLLAREEPRIHRTVISQQGVPAIGLQEVDLNELGPYTKAELFDWLAKTTLQPPLPQPTEPQPSMDEIIKEDQADRQKRADHAGGMARMEQYADEQGLERTSANGDAVADWLNENLRGYLSSAGVDAAIQWLGPKGTNVLTWTPKAAPPQPEQPAAEVLGTLPNGEPRLPLDVPPTNRASKEQIKDWLARTRESTGKYLRPTGSFGSRF
jgi:hypothetical protein